MGNSPIVNRINSLLAERGIDKKKFYEDCGITSASYSLWNTGKTKPRMKNLEIIDKLSNFFNETKYCDDFSKDKLIFSEKDLIHPNFSEVKCD